MFEELGWDEAAIEAGIANDDESLESQSWEHVGHRASAGVLVERALEKIEAEMLVAVADEAPPSP